jgi:hypothetical protein
MLRIGMTVLFIFAGFLLADTSSAAEAVGSTVTVLNKTSFVVVTERAHDDSSVMLFSVEEGRIKLLDVIVVDGNFYNVTRPSAKVTRAAVSDE